MGKREGKGQGKGEGDGYGPCECPGGICCIIWCSPWAWCTGEGVNLCCAINAVPATCPPGQNFDSPSDKSLDPIHQYSTRLLAEISCYCLRSSGLCSGPVPLFRPASFSSRYHPTPAAELSPLYVSLVSIHKSCSIHPTRVFTVCFMCAPHNDPSLFLFGLDRRRRIKMMIRASSAWSDRVQGCR